MDNPLVSIVTPCYNGAPYLPRFFDSILNQTYKHLEVIFVDDGSQDDTKKVVDQYSSKFKDSNIEFIYIYQDNGGQASALNRGLKYFKGEYLSCVDSDDELGNNFIFNKLKYMQDNIQCHFCYGNTVFIDQTSKDVILEKGRIDFVNETEFFEDVLYSKKIVFSAYMFITSSFDSIIKNREIYCGRGGQNAQLLIPFSWHYGNPGYVRDSEYFYYCRSNSHSHSKNTSEKVIKQYENYLAILLNTLELLPSDMNKIKKKVSIYYSKIMYGNAIDTKNSQLIKKYYYNLKKLKCVNFKEFLLYLKYTNKCFEKIMNLRK